MSNTHENSRLKHAWRNRTQIKGKALVYFHGRRREVSVPEMDRIMSVVFSHCNWGRNGSISIGRGSGRYRRMCREGGGGKTQGYWRRWRRSEQLKKTATEWKRWRRVRAKKDAARRRRRHDTGEFLHPGPLLGARRHAARGGGGGDARLMGWLGRSMMVKTPTRRRGVWSWGRRNGRDAVWLPRR